MRMRHIVICGLAGFTIFFHIISYMAKSRGKKVIELKMCFLIFSFNFCPKRFPFQEELNEI